jgi:hypothetical protein
VPAPGAGLEQLRVALYSTERGVAELTSPAREPDWIREVGDDVAGSMTETLERLAIALTNVDDIQPLAIVAGDARALREQTAIRTLSAAAAVITLGAAEMIAASMSQARRRRGSWPCPDGAGRTARPGPAGRVAFGTDSRARDRPRDTGRDRRGRGWPHRPSVGVAVVSWTASVFITGSSGASTRRAWTRVLATMVGARWPELRSPPACRTRSIGYSPWP